MIDLVRKATLKSMFSEAFESDAKITLSVVENHKYPCEFLPAMYQQYLRVMIPMARFFPIKEDSPISLFKLNSSLTKDPILLPFDINPELFYKTGPITFVNNFLDKIHSRLLDLNFLRIVNFMDINMLCGFDPFQNMLLSNLQLAATNSSTRYRFLNL